jgi:hypothetical protein
MLLKWENNVEEEIQSLIDRYAALPRHIAKKHLQAAMKRTLKDGIPILRSVTPPLGVRRGRRKKGAFVPQNKSTGALRRAVTTKSKYIGRNADGVVYGVVGYKAGYESRKAIWLEYGTRRGIRPQQMIHRFMQQYAGPSLATLKSEMVNALDKAQKEIAGGKNEGYKP